MQARITSAYAQTRAGSDVSHSQRKVGGKSIKEETILEATAKVEDSLPSSTAREDETTLRQFDLESRFGPVSGISRLQRWERAASLGLEPPENVRRIIMQRGVSTSFNEHLFTEGKV